MSKNTNRDYLIIVDVKTSTIREFNKLEFYINDKESHNIFVQLVIKESHDIINKYVPIDDPNLYELTMNIVKPTNEYKQITGELISLEDGLYEFKLPQDCCDKVGTYECELETKYNSRITNSNRIKYRIKKSVLNDLDGIVDAPGYPIVIQLFDKLSDIDQYEEDRRANELARQLAEEQRQTRFDALDADMVDSIQAMDNKVADVENRISAKEEAIDTLIVDTKADIDEYKVAKDQEIDEYKALKDTEINNAITTQDNKINEFINERNDRLDALENKDALHNSRLDAIEAKNTEQDNRLDVAENRLANIGNDITNTMQPIIDGHTARLEAIEAIDVSQNNRLDAIEAKNSQQDDRLSDIEKVNSRQDIDIKCLYGASQTIDVAKEGNSIYLQNSNNGFTIIDEIKGNTLVNCNKEPDKEIILNGNINTKGYSNVTLTEGVDGGLVDVALEGNTMVNVCGQKDPVAITKSYTVETGNHVALQGEYDGKCRPVVNGNTLWIDNDTEDVLTAFDDTKNLRLQSSFEDKVVTQEMVDAGEELAENLGKYKVDYVVTGKNKINKPYTTNLVTDVGDKYVCSDGDTRDYISLKLQSWGTPNTSSSVKWTDYVTSNATSTGKYSKKFTKTENDKYLRFANNGLKKEFNMFWDISHLKNGDYIFSFELLNLTVGALEFRNFQIEEGDAVTSYEPYKEYKKTFYLNTPLLEGDTIQQNGNNVVHVHRSEIRAYQTDDELTLPTDMTNTLVAKATPQYEVISQNDTILCDSYVNGHLDVDSVVPIKRVNFRYVSFKCKYLYTNTAYSIQFESDNVGKLDRIALGANGVITNLDVVKGINKFNITTGNSIGYGYLDMYGIGFNASNIVVTEATDQNFGYFEGMKSVGECEGNKIEILSSTNNTALKNIETYGITLPNELSDTFINGVYTKNVGKFIVNEKTDFVPKQVSKNTNTFRYAIKITGMKVRGIDDSSINSLGDTLPYLWSDKDTIHYKVGVSPETLFVYIPMEYKDKPNEYFKENPFTLYYELSTPIEFKLNKKQILLNEPLRAVGDIKDKYVLIDGKWYIERNCAEVVLDINSQWFKGSNNTNYLDVRCHINSPYACSSDKGGICNIIPYKSNKNGSWIAEDFGVTCMSVSNKIQVIISIENSKLQTQDVAGFKQWLQQNPTTIVYQLQTPQYEPIDYNSFEVYSDITHISNNSTIPCNMTIKNTGYNCLLKPSTTYTVSSNLGLNTVTTPAELTEDCLRFYDTDTSTVTKMKNVTILEGDYTTGKPLPSHFSGIESCFEQEYDEAAGKYKVKIRVQNEDASKENYIEFYINEPLRGIGDVKDKVYVKDDKVVVERNCGQREYQDGDFETFLTDKVNTVYQLAEPIYEEVEYDDIKLFIESFKNSTLFYNSNVPVTSKLYYSYSVPIVDTVARTEDISNQQDSMIIDLATQCAVMEMMLM